MSRQAKRPAIDWCEDELVHWIGTDERPLKRRSRYVYKKAFITYVEFSRMMAKQLIDEAEAESSLPRRQQGRVKRKLLQYREWLLTDYVRSLEGIPRSTAVWVVPYW